jgi:ribosome recycling factor
MKKRFFYFIATLLFALCTLTANASSDTKAIRERIDRMTDGQKQERIEQIQQRVEEIKAMDRSQLTKAQRRDLKEELKDMNKEAKLLKGGVYISLAGIIIIILLLILIF